MANNGGLKEDSKKTVVCSGVGGGVGGGEGDKSLVLSTELIMYNGLQKEIQELSRFKRYTLMRDYRLKQ